MSKELDSVLGELARRLETTGATSRVRQGRIVPSVVYDLRYRIAIVSIVFAAFSKPLPSLPSRRWLRSDKLKFIQFVAIRPWLTATVSEWSHARGNAQQSMFTSDRLRRGFLADTTHDRVIDFMVAASVLARHPNGTHLMEGRLGEDMGILVQEVVEHSLFDAERGAVAEFDRFTLTTAMLEGR